MSLTVHDDGGGVTTHSRTFDVLNVAPTLRANVSPVSVWAGEIATNTGVWSDAGADVVTLTASLGAVTKNADGTWGWSYVTTVEPFWNRTVTITATDDDGGTSRVTFPLWLNPVVQLPGGRGTNSAVLSHNGDNIQVLNNKKVLFSEPQGSFRALKILGAARKSDTLTVAGSAMGPLSGLGRIVFDGGTGSSLDTLVLNGTSGADTFTVGDSSVLLGVDQPVRVDVGGIERLTLNGAGGDDTFQVSGLGTRTTIADSPGNDVVDFSTATTAVKIDLASNSPQRIFAPANVNANATLVLMEFPKILRGTRHDDVIHGTSGSDCIYGLDGNDTIYGRGGRDTLFGGPGDDWLHGDAGSDTLVGGAGNNVLLGGAGDDVLNALDDTDAAGRNLLIGGPGADTLRGGPGEEVLIGGTTSYDNKRAVLAAVMKEWTSATAFGERCDLLENGFKHPAAGFVQLKRRDRLNRKATVLDDGIRDSLFGGPASDWFFDFASDDVRDRTLPEDR
jgi:Ca2+-binding RTX toxin-like protein